MVCSIELNSDNRIQKREKEIMGGTRFKTALDRLPRNVFVGDLKERKKERKKQVN